jgi:hypothetical protein
MHRRVSSSAIALFFAPFLAPFLAGTIVTGTIATQAFAKTAEPDTEETSDDEPAPSKEPSKSPVSKAQARVNPPEQAPGVGLPPAQEPVKIETGSGTSIRFGILIQPVYEAATSRANDIRGWGQNLYVHRLRLMVGGTLLHDFEYFMATDYPDLFKQVNTVDSMGAPTYLKNFPGMSLQDAFVTYRPIGDLFKVDAGYMLPPMAHNAVQGAATLYGGDYFANTFLHKDAFGTTANPRVFNPNSNPLGRDLGVQLRGLLLRGLFEYRVGIFQGRRTPPGGVSIDMPTAPGGRNFFRVTGRIQINLLDPETGFFYAGTYLGTKRILSLGASGDFQAEYKYWAYDALLDLPLGPGVVTAQVNVAQWDGGTWLPAPFLVKERALMSEAGYLIAPIRLSPIVRFEQRWVASTVTGAAQTEKRMAAGLAFWPYGHNSNLKAFFARAIPNAPDTHTYDEFTLQWQIYFF